MECVKHITVFAIQFDMTNIWDKCVHTCSSRVGNDAYFTDEDSPMQPEYEFTVRKYFAAFRFNCLLSKLKIGNYFMHVVSFSRLTRTKKMDDFLL